MLPHLAVLQQFLSKNKNITKFCLWPSILVFGISIFFTHQASTSVLGK